MSDASLIDKSIVRSDTPSSLLAFSLSTRMIELRSWLAALGGGGHTVALAVGAKWARELALYESDADAVRFIPPTGLPLLSLRAADGGAYCELKELYGV